jgi:primary-amine oxidase
VNLDVLQPNKTDALAYLDESGPEPTRFARATLQFGSTVQPYTQEYMVGPLPIQDRTAKYEELNYMFTSGRGRMNVYNADSNAIATFNIKVGASIKEITQELVNGVSTDVVYLTYIVLGR